MEIIIRNNHNVPIYEQIVRQIKEQIISGKLPQGEMLPSMRKLARSLQISVITVQKAYEKLQNENYIETVVGLGTFVAEPNLEFIKEERQRKVEAHLQQAIEISRSCGISLEKLIELLKIFSEED